MIQPNILHHTFHKSIHPLVTVTAVPADCIAAPAHPAIPALSSTRHDPAARSDNRTPVSVTSVARLSVTAFSTAAAEACVSAIAAHSDARHADPAITSRRVSVAREDAAARGIHATAVCIARVARLRVPAVPSVAAEEASVPAVSSDGSTGTREASIASLS